MNSAQNGTREARNSPENRDASHRTLLRLIVVVSAFIAAAHLIAAFVPTSKNWGVHHLAFFPRVVRLTIPILMLLTLLPAVQAMLIEYMSHLNNWYERQRKTSKKSFVVVLLLVCCLFFWLLRERTFFLGDGFMMVKWLGIIDRVRGIPVFFTHEPLTGFLHWSFSLGYSWLGVSARYELAMQTVSIIFGVGSVLIVMLMARELFSTFADRFLFGLFLLAAGTSQLFFGYVENYTPAYCGLLGYTLLAMMYLRGKISLVVPSVTFGVLFVLYFGVLGFIPTLMYLYYRAARLRNIREIVLSIIATSVTVGGMLWIFGYTLTKLKEIFLEGEGHIVSMVTVSSWWRAYSMFSIEHLLEVANLYLLLLPYVPCVLLLIVFHNYREKSLYQGEGGFLLLSGSVGLLLTTVLNPDIGMSRDWDLMSPFFLCGIVSVGWLLVKFVGQATRQKVFVMMIVIMMLHTMPWIAVNADVDRSLARFNMLPDEDLWGRNAFRVYEELGMYYEEHHDTLRTIMYYERFLAHDSMNVRMMGNLFGLYLSQGNEEKALAWGEKAIRGGTPVPEVYYNVGSYYAKRERFNEALSLMRKSFDLDPTKSIVSFGIGVLYLRMKDDYESALHFFNHTIKLDPFFAKAYLNAGFCLAKLNKPSEARKYFNQYFIMEPSDSRKEKINELLELDSTNASALTKPSAQQ